MTRPGLRADATYRETRSPGTDAPPDGREWYLVALLVIGYGAYNLDKSIVSILIEPLKREFALTDTWIALLTGFATALPMAIVCIPLGMLADRVRRVPLLCVLLVGWSAMTAGAGLATGVALLFVARIGVGAFESGYTPISMSLLADSFAPSRRATAMGTYVFGGAIGTMMGLALGGIVADGWGWRSAFFLAGLPGVLLAALMWATLKEPTRGKLDTSVQSSEKPVSLREAMTMFRTVPGLAAVGIAMTLGATALAILSIWLPALLIRVEDVPLRDAGFIAALLYGGGGALGPVLGGWIADRVGRGDPGRALLVPIVSLLLAAAFGLFALLLAPTHELVLIGLGLSCLLQPFYLGVGYATVSLLAGPGARSTILSVLLVAFNLLSYGVGLLLVGLLSDWLAPAAGVRSIAWAVSSGYILGIVAAFAFWRALRALQHPRQIAW